MPKARGKEHNLQDPGVDTPPVPLEERSEHHQGEHLDPADRKHFWQHPAATHDPYPDPVTGEITVFVPPVPAEPSDYPRWVHQRSEDGSRILDSKLVQDADAYARRGDGWE